MHIFKRTDKDDCQKKEFRVILKKINRIGENIVFRAKEYRKVQSLEEAYELNQKRSAMVVGGMMWVKMSAYQKSILIDLSELGLNTIEETEDEFRIGCMCTLRDLEMHEGLNRTYGNMMKECTRHIVGVQFRNGATVGGSIFGRFGFSDILTAFLVLDAYVELHHAGVVALKDFIHMPKDRDILVRVILKKDGRSCAYTSQRRTQTDFPLLAAAAAKKDDQWLISIGARPASAELVTAEDSENLAELAEKVVSQFRFGTNLRGSGEYRRALAVIYVRRLMEQIKKEEETE